MQVQFTARHMELTDTLREYATTKVEKLKRYMDLIVDAHVTLSVEKYRHQAEVRIKGKRGVVSGAEVSDDMYLSIDRVFDKIEKQLRRRKDRRVQKRQLRTEEMESKGIPITEVNTDEDETIDAFSIIRNEIGDNIVEDDITYVKKMNMEEALLLFKAADEEYLVYHDTDSDDNLSLLYRRRDGKYGIIRIMED